MSQVFPDYNLLTKDLWTTLKENKKLEQVTVMAKSSG
jgi:hypothetical protein